MAGDLSDEVGIFFDFFSFGGFLAAENFRKVPKKNERVLEQKFTQVLRCVFFLGGGGSKRN